jgi:uncharacterized protein (TIGR02271 family)
MTITHRYDQALGRNAYDVAGHKIGAVTSLYTSDYTGEPEWVTVNTGLFGTKESFVPLAGARLDGDGLYVAAPKDLVKDAPRIDSEGHLSEAETAELYRHYNLVEPHASGRDQDGQFGDPHHRSGSMVRSEERLRAGTETVETGRVKLRKHVVTEQQQMTVPVSHEEVRVVREPVSPDQAGTRDLGQIGEDEREVVLHEERPVVAKETVPVERVGLETERIQGEQEVSDTVRKERVEVEGLDGDYKP